MSVARLDWTERRRSSGLIDYAVRESLAAREFLDILDVIEGPKT
jgi:hypothetical protein